MDVADGCGECLLEMLAEEDCAGFVLRMAVRKVAEDGC